ncbi:MAG: MarR family transcriptional regulator [Pseudomonadota bacterium]
MAPETRPKAENIERLRHVVHLLIRAFLVSGRAGRPAQGKLPFNPLYFHILGHIREHGPTRPSRLAEALDVPKTTLSTAAKALQSRGLLTHTPDPEDGRAKRLALSADGVETANAILAQDLLNMQVLLSQLDTDEHGPLLDQLERVVDGVMGTLAHIDRDPP